MVNRREDGQKKQYLEVGGGPGYTCGLVSVYDGMQEGVFGAG